MSTELYINETTRKLCESYEQRNFGVRFSGHGSLFIPQHPICNKTFEDAKKLDDYLLNTIYFDTYNEDEELQKLCHMAGKKVSELTPEQKIEVSNYITTTLRPVLLYKAPGDSKLLVNEIPEFQTTSYKELCDTIIINKEECSYCKCKMSLLNTKYVESGLTFDAIISLYGHKKDNITLCCSLCNSKKTFKYSQ
jgi:hypothetical protein